jgi:two-component system cell cycle sensor histidine kinase/response regulator CckA
MTDSKKPRKTSKRKKHDNKAGKKQTPEAIGKALLAGMPLGVLSVARSGAVLYANRKMEEMIGAEPGKMRNVRDFVRLSGAVRGGRLRKAEGQFLEAIREASFEWECDGSGQRRRRLRFSSFRLGKDFDGKEAVGLIGHEMRERTSEAALVQTTRQLENLMIFVRGVAHDFNNLVGSILGYASFIKSLLRPEERLYRQIDAIERSAIQSSELTKQLLTCCLGTRYRSVALNLNALVEKVIEDARPLVGESIRIEAMLEENLWSIDGDEDQIEQMIMHLCTKAKDALPHGGRLVLATDNYSQKEGLKEEAAEVSPGDYVMLTITYEAQEDTGCVAVVKPDEWQRDDVGLAMVYSNVKKHSGFIDISEVRGNAQHMQLFFPVSAALIEEERALYIPLGRGSERLLIIDGDEKIGPVYQQLLEVLGYQPLSISDGEKAIRYFRKNSRKIDLVVLDVADARLGGERIVRQIRRVRPRMRVLYTGRERLAEILKHVKPGRNDAVLQKPFEFAHLVWAIREMLDAPRRNPRHY